MHSIVEHSPIPYIGRQVLHQQVSTKGRESLEHGFANETGSANHYLIVLLLHVSIQHRVGQTVVLGALGTGPGTSVHSHDVQDHSSDVLEGYVSHTQGTVQ